MTPDERVDLVVRHERADGLERADELDVGGRQADLLLGLAQRGRPQVLVGEVLAAARERDLARVALEVVAPLGEDRMQRAAVEVERHEHRGVLGPGRVERGRRLRREKQRPEVGRRGHTSSSSLVEHDLALERAVDGALGDDLHEPLPLLLRQLLGQLDLHVELGRRAALGGLVVDVDDDFADVPALAVRVHLHRDRAARGEARREQLLRTGPLVGTAGFLGLVGDQVVVVGAELDLVFQGAVCAACDRSHFLPSKSSGWSVSAYRAIA